MPHHRLNRQTAAMVGHDVFDDRQAKTGAGDLAAAALIGPVKPLAQARQVFALDARPLILNPHPDRRIADGHPVGCLQQRHPLTLRPGLRCLRPRHKPVRRNAAADRDPMATL
ncbi:MAG: hypothetical protein CVT79_07290 [Alphaproteobacteria bacterium HGW-Alphaproteobacteria-18]|nr:MAG: hypothetical protein CVT79_07290 [Alphaproteobacteria bacterium HGW-Alphaproteobacteria-18]